MIDVKCFLLSFKFKKHVSVSVMYLPLCGTSFLHWRLISLNSCRINLCHTDCDWWQDELDQIGRRLQEAVDREKSLLANLEHLEAERQQAVEREKTLLANLEHLETEQQQTRSGINCVLSSVLIHFTGHIPDLVLDLCSRFKTTTIKSYTPIRLCIHYS